MDARPLPSQPVNANFTVEDWPSPKRELPRVPTAHRRTCGKWPEWDPYLSVAGSVTVEGLFA